MANLITIINSVHCDYNHPNAQKLFKIINNPCAWTLLHVSTINRHPQRDIMKRYMHLYYILPEDGDLSSKHVGGFRKVDYLWFYINFVHMVLYRVIQNDFRGFNNLSYTIHFRWEYIAVYSYTDGSRNSQSFLFWCVVCSSYTFLRLERSLLRLTPSPLTCYKQFGKNSIFMLMFVES
jgi:hypothetical protein